MTYNFRPAIWLTVYHMQWFSTNYCGCVIRRSPIPRARTNPVTVRAKFVLAAEEDLYSVTELCQRYNISRETGYKGLCRYRDGGMEALTDRSRPPEP